LGRPLSYFVSDVHLGLDVHDPDAREARFVHFLKSIEPQKTENIFLLGDIFDFWYEYRDVVPKGHVRLFSALLDLMDSGVKVYFFQGNHDVWTYAYFEELGMKKLLQPCLMTIGDKRFCLGHGDGLGRVPAGYRFLRSLFHSRVAQALFSSLHPSIAFRLGYGWSKHNRLAHDIQYRFDDKNEPLVKFAEDYSGCNKVDYFIFGHYHAHVDLCLATGARMVLTTDWIRSTNALVYDASEDSLIYLEERL